MLGLFDCKGNLLGAYKTMRGAMIAKGKRMRQLWDAHDSLVKEKGIIGNEMVCEIRLIG